jgi:hypothetical protein
MQTASLFLSNALKQGSVLFAKPRVIAEWNHNRYTAITTVDNFGYAEATNGYDLDMFPIETITETMRPTAGILKGRSGEGAVVQGYMDLPSDIRTYTVGQDSKYKYWTGPNQSNTVVYSGGGYTLPETVQPYIIYDSNIYTNKLYVCVENSWSSPKKWDVQITLNGTTWTTVSSDVVPNSKGQVILYRQSDGSWNSTVQRNYPVNIRGVRLIVKSMVKSKSWFNLIELSPRLEADLTGYVMDYSVKNEMSDPDFISPLGIISSNTGTITLSNVDGTFNTDNAASPYYGLIDANTKFTLDAGIDVSTWGGSGYEYIRQATMYAESWSGEEDTVEIQLKDASKFLQEINPLSQLMENVTIGMAIWKMLDSIGFGDYKYINSADVASTTIAYYWTDKNKTVWDNIQEICRTTQTAAYFDEFGILQIKTRDAAFDKTKSVSWTLDYHKNGTKNPDIVELSVGSTFEANKATIKYQKTNLAVDTLGNPISEILWQPEDDIVLRSSSLQKTMGASDNVFWITQEEAALWPFEGIVNIRGELIRYKGKGYRYYPGSYTANFAHDTVFKIINSTDEKIQLDNKSNQFNKWRNYYTGYINVIERGYDITTPQEHEVTLQYWTGRYGSIGGTQKVWNGGIKHIKDESIMRLQTNKTFRNSDWYVVDRTAAGNAPFQYIGTRLRFPSSPKGTHQLGGICFYENTSRNQMYTVDVVTTAKCNRSVGNEIRILKRSGGTVTQIGGKGAVFGISDNQWIDLDVVVSGSTFTVSVNGTQVLRATDSSGPISSTGGVGLYCRGYTTVDFEYFYALDQNAMQDNDLDNQSYLDIINGGYYSNQYYDDNLHSVRRYHARRGLKSSVYKQWYDRRVFDEFGMKVHEVRPYDITFDKFPALYSSLYESNTYQTVEDEYIHSPFGAKFIIANAARQNAVLNGEDTLTYGVDNPITQKMVITGRTIQQAEAIDYVVKNDLAIRARGEISIDIESQWIQSEGAAKALGDWIVDNWSEPSDNIEVQVFGNPLHQIGDFVSINYPPKNMTASTHKYWVIGVQQEWDDGIVTTLQLRRARI